MSSSSSSSRNDTSTSYKNNNLQDAQGNLVTDSGAITITDSGAISGNVDVAKSALNLSGNVANEFGKNTLDTLSKALDFANKNLDISNTNTQSLLKSASNTSENALTAVREAKQSDASQATTGLYKTLGLATAGLIFTVLFYFVSKKD